MAIETRNVDVRKPYLIGDPSTMNDPDLKQARTAMDGLAGDALEKADQIRDDPAIRSAQRQYKLNPQQTAAMVAEKTNEMLVKLPAALRGFVERVLPAKTREVEAKKAALLKKVIGVDPASFASVTRVSMIVAALRKMSPDARVIAVHDAVKDPADEGNRELLNATLWAPRIMGLIGDEERQLAVERILLATNPDDAKALDDLESEVGIVTEAWGQLQRWLTQLAGRAIPGRQADADQNA